jgi:trehalose 6-phosphate phosphatase
VRLDGASPRFLVGNHGLEPGSGIERYRSLIRRTQRVLAADLGREPGIDFENKSYTLSIHHRGVRAKRDVHARVAAAVRKTGLPVRLISGKAVVNVVPDDAPDKGATLLRLRDESRAHAALFIGDDATDESVFLLDEPGRLLTVRVGLSRSSSASYYIRSQAEIDELLELFLEHRGGTSR